MSERLRAEEISAMRGGVRPNDRALTLLLDAYEESKRLRGAIAEHHSQNADDRCWLDDQQIYGAAGLPIKDASIGDPDAMLENCKRFIAQRCKPGGQWKSYRELEQEVELLRAVFTPIKERGLYITIPELDAMQEALK